MPDTKTNSGSRLLPAILLSLLVILLTATVVFSAHLLIYGADAPTEGLDHPDTQPSTQVTEPSTEPSTEPTKPPVKLQSTATILATGDILPHTPILYHCQYGSEYRFDNIFPHLSSYISKADYAIANLETTFGGPECKYGYDGYPRFNTPDTMADAIKAAGFDMLLTANNHTNDSDDIGMIRTLDVISGLGMDFLGTKYTADAPDYVIKEVNGISIGMVCYTYEYPGSTEEKISLNGLPLTVESTKLVSSFNYDRLDAFYAKAERHIQAMKVQGAEATVVFIHWGAEYKLVQNDTQSAIAQKLCDLGVDVIVGGHPHVVQPMELLTSTDGSHKTVCLYSTGNLLSNQRRDQMRLDTGHTEDALLFNFTFAKYSDGTVVLQSADITPAWVNMYAEGGRFVYSIVPLDPGADWAQFGLAGQTLAEAQASYQRTMDIVSPGLRQIREYLRQNVADTEANIGVN